MWQFNMHKTKESSFVCISVLVMTINTCRYSQWKTAHHSWHKMKRSEEYKYNVNSCHYSSFNHRLKCILLFFRSVYFVKSIDTLTRHKAMAWHCLCPLICCAVNFITWATCRGRCLFIWSQLFLYTQFLFDQIICDVQILNMCGVCVFFLLLVLCTFILDEQNE